ncbi:hypothetical protein [Pseudooceanicola sp.]|uniref:hypothetical protein n=1 Tax=Pseudooceanicola sp. TaxID=1914328 RepID=UPI0040596ACD
MAEELADLRADLAAELHACQLRSNSLSLLVLAVNSIRANGLPVELEFDREERTVRAAVFLGDVTMSEAPLPTAPAVPDPDWIPGLDLPPPHRFTTRRKT